ncbi:MAG TPA: hypothetical protein VF103_06450, partial [Polyangiaceae bacterium]
MRPVEKQDQCRGFEPRGRLEALDRAEITRRRPHPRTTCAFRVVVGAVGFHGGQGVVQYRG